MASRQDVQDHRVGLEVEIEEKIKRCFRKLDSMLRGHCTEKGDVFGREEVKFEFVILCLFRKEFKYLYVFSIRLKAFDKILDGEMLLLVFNGENDSYRSCFCIGDTGQGSL